MLPHPIFWAGRFFVGLSSARDGDRAIKAAVVVIPGWTLLKFYCSLCLILSSCISTASVLVVLHICFRPYPPPPSSFCISFVVPIVSPICYISDPSVSTAVQSSILIHCSCNLVCMILISSPNCLSHAVLVRCRLHHSASLPPPSLLFYISSASLLSLFLLY